jgi:hypothetical protein
MKETKKCFKCGLEKSYSEFYKHKKTSDGYLGKCKTCTKSDVKKRSDILKTDDKWIELERKRGREKYHRLGYKNNKPNHTSKRFVLINYSNIYPEKYNARIISQRVPIDEGLERHHWSYNIEHAKDIIPLSVRHHAKAHRFIVYDQERFMYRRYDTNELLDTKDKHIQFINYCILNKED